jgi:hypothetical protein
MSLALSTVFGLLNVLILSAAAIYGLIHRTYLKVWISILPWFLLCLCIIEITTIIMAFNNIHNNHIVSFSDLFIVIGVTSIYSMIYSKPIRWVLVVLCAAYCLFFTYRWLTFASPDLPDAYITPVSKLFALCASLGSLALLLNGPEIEFPERNKEFVFGISLAVYCAGTIFLSLYLLEIMNNSFKVARYAYLLEPIFQMSFYLTCLYLFVKSRQESRLQVEAK